MRHLLALLLLGLTTAASAQLPQLSIVTNGGEEPTCQYVFPPEGAMGISITHNEKLPGRCVLTLAADTLYDSGPYQKNLSGMTIRVRGNTSAYYAHKKPFKIKLEKKADLLARGEQRFNDKNWLLINDGWEGLRVPVATAVARLAGFSWTPAHTYVELTLNGDYRGIYLLIESVRRNADCRIDVDRHTGYLFERDPYWWNEDVFFTTQSGREFTFKHPDTDTISTEQTDYLRQVMNQAEQAISDGTYPRHIDVEAWARWMLTHDILGTGDAGGSNLYLTKYDSTDTSLVAMTTPWDFDSIEKTEGQWANIHTDPFFYYPELFTSANPAFLRAYTALWQHIGPQLNDYMEQVFDSLALQAEALDSARQRDQQRWGYVAGRVADDISDNRRWFTARCEWLNTQIGQLVAAGIAPATVATRLPYVCSLDGRRHRATAALPPGIYISNGRKVVVAARK